MAKPKRRGRQTKRKKKLNVPKGRVYIHSTFNNTIVTITDEEGNVVTWASGGTVGFKGTKKGTAYAAQLAAEQACRRAMDMGMAEVEIYTKGPGSGKDAAVRTVNNVGLKVNLIKDITPVPHNGCRPKKRKRG